MLRTGTTNSHKDPRKMENHEAHEPHETSRRRISVHPGNQWVNTCVRLEEGSLRFQGGRVDHLDLEQFLYLVCGRGSVSLEIVVDVDEHVLRRQPFDPLGPASDLIRPVT